MKTSFIATVFNEENSIDSFVESILSQTKLPDEIIIVDGGSSDQTVAKIKNQILKIKNSTIVILAIRQLTERPESLSEIRDAGIASMTGNICTIKLIIKKGNRSIGRNEGIKNATGDIILISDAGCVLDRHWVENIIKPFNPSADGPKVDVVAGYYKGKSETVFQKCLVPYVLVMPDKVDPNNFLPASRSVAFKKSIWKKVGGFKEEFSHNEDYVFAQQLKKIKTKIVFAKNAIVYWIPRKNLKSAFVMFFRFALGDSESGIIRNKAIFIFTRYALGFYLMLLSFIERSPVPLSLVVLGIFLYIIWSIKKNYKYVKDKNAFFILPLIQFVSDIAVILGTTVGLLMRIKLSSVIMLFKTNKGIAILIGIYVLLILMVINKGIPNINHPFTYQMDEWHQAQAVRTVFSQGSPNVSGSANGSMFHFLLSGLFLAPFIFIGIVNPFAIKSSVQDLEMQQKLFQVLRLNTLFFGVISIILLAYIAKKYFKLNPIFASFLFVVNPIWIILSNYFKYDIALIFWILLSLLSFFEYTNKPTLLRFIIAGIISALSLSVKISAIALFPTYVLIFFLYSPNIKKNIRVLVFGFFAYVSTFLIFGIPDLLLGRGNIYEYLHSNLIRSPAATDALLLDTHYIPFLLFKIYPLEFGYGLYVAFLVGSLFFITGVFKNYNKSNLNYYFRLLKRNKTNAILVSSFVFFVLSLIPLKIGASSNRILVLLPHIVLLTILFLRRIIENMQKRIGKIILAVCLSLIALIQIFESFAFIYIKIAKSSQEISSVWIQNNIPKKQTIGIENIPIYQHLPDVILKEFYFNKYHLSQKNKYTYQIVDSKSIKMPNLIVITNADIEMKIFKESAKKNLLIRIKKEGYGLISTFYPDLTFYKMFGDDIGYYFSGLVLDPTISIFKKY